MPNLSTTAVVLIDPLNDFLHSDGKLTSLLKDLDERNAIQNLKNLVKAARLHGLPIYYGLHQEYSANNFNGWRHMTPNQVKQQHIKYFEKGTFGSQIYEGLEPDLETGDVVVSRHWNSDSFENTDLNFQLRQRDITNLVFAGLTANTCLESTARHAYELGYDVTLLKDATAGWSKELTNAAELVWPLFSRVLTAKEWEDTLDAKKL
ncbi:uncharacterized protein MYU51_015517 [Penicillium brevicompactum]|uniref:uncharacterized protein n=1 Tax=Penicillium brevicompactum TaxID=5074 RepID=UPI0025408514|nr:uncharacterized protein N7506_001101 [Penicillium brevicompactum]KAJ5347848.1 hypothetical protein N7506_001101 [Penicillium brevicompactum]